MRRHPQPIAATLTLIAALVTSFFAASHAAPSNAQNSNRAGARPKPVTSPRDAASGLPTGLKPVIVVKSEHFGPRNVARSVNVNFDKTVKDALGAPRRVQISRVDLLKTPGVRYAAKVDGEPRDIAYLSLNGGRVRLVNVEGGRPEHNLYRHSFREPSAGGLLTEFMTQNRLLTEFTIPWAKAAGRRPVNFSMPQKYVDSHSFALHVLDPINVPGLEPGKLFGSTREAGGGGVRPADPVRPPDWGNLFPPIEVLFRCVLRPKNIQKCEGGCTRLEQDDPAEALTAGVSARRLCKDAGCIQCAGMCCEPSLCTSETNTEPFFDCGGGASAN